VGETQAERAQAAPENFAVMFGEAETKGQDCIGDEHQGPGENDLPPVAAR
jgi:hypothetical protein